MPTVAKEFEFKRTRDGATFFLDGVEFPWHVDPEVTISNIGNESLPLLNISIVLDADSVTTK